MGVESGRSGPATVGSAFPVGEGAGADVAVFGCDGVARFTGVDVGFAVGVCVFAREGYAGIGKLGVGVRYVPHRLGTGAQALTTIESANTNERNRLTARPSENYTCPDKVRIEIGLVN